MKTSEYRLLMFFSLFVGIFASVQPVCAQDLGTGDDSKNAWNSPKILRLKGEYDSLEDTYRKTPKKIFKETDIKHAAGQPTWLQRRLFRERLSDKDVRELAASCESLPVLYKNWTEFDYMIFSFVIDVLGYSRDHESLIGLLSKRYPTFCHDTFMEHYLAKMAASQDSVLILGEAYSQCKIPDVRREIAKSIRRGFAGLGISQKDEDDVFVKNAMQWYKKEKDHLVVNPGYWQNSHDPGLDWQIYEENPQYSDKPDPRIEPLFKEKPISEEPPRKPETDPPALKDANKGKLADWMPLETSIDPKIEKQELSKMEGDWTVVEEIFGGEPLQQEQINEVRFVFHDDVLTMFDAEGKKVNECRVRVGSPRQPFAMDLIELAKPKLKKEETTPLIYELQKETTSAIYELKGDSLRICTASPGNWQRPTSFEPEIALSEATYILKRISK